MAGVTDLVASLSPTRRELLLRELSKKRGAAPAPDIAPRRGAGDASPLSFAQQRLWVLDQLDPDNPAWNIYLAAHLTGPLNAAALAQSVAEIVRRHESLRTTFAYVAGQPAQVRSAARGPEPLPLASLEGLPEEAGAGAAARLAGEEARRPFSLTRGPLLRATVLRLGPAHHVALLTMHHIISDGWSLGVFMRELAALYGAFSAGRPSPLAELPIQYADFARWQREWLRGEVLERQLSYWRSQLDGAGAYAELPADRPRPAVRSYAGGVQNLTLPPSLAEELGAVGRRAGATLFMTLLAAFIILLRHQTGRDEVVVGTDIANRNRWETEGLIGFFVNHPVLRVTTAGDPTFRELLGRVREVSLGAYEHQDAPFEKVVEELRASRAPGQTPLFQVLFVLQNSPLPERGLPGLSLTPLRVHNGTTKFDLFVSTAESEAGLTFTVEYSEELFTRGRIARLLGHYENLLRAAAADPETTLGAFVEAMAEEERRRLSRGEEELEGAHRRRLHTARRRAVTLEATAPEGGGR